MESMNYKDTDAYSHSSYMESTHIQESTALENPLINVSC